MTNQIEIGGTKYTIHSERVAGPNTRREKSVSHTLTLVGPRGAVYSAWRKEANGEVVIISRVGR